MEISKKDGQENKHIYKAVMQLSLSKKVNEANISAIMVDMWKNLNLSANDRIEVRFSHGRYYFNESKNITQDVVIEVLRLL